MAKKSKKAEVVIEVEKPDLIDSALAETKPLRSREDELRDQGYTILRPKPSPGREADGDELIRVRVVRGNLEYAHEMGVWSVTLEDNGKAVESYEVFEVVFLAEVETQCRFDVAGGGCGGTYAANTSATIVTRGAVAVKLEN